MNGSQTLSFSKLFKRNLVYVTMWNCLRPELMISWIDMSHGNLIQVHGRQTLSPLIGMSFLPIVFHFLFDSQNSTKTRTDRSGMHSHCAFVGYPTLVHETTSSADRHISTFAQEEESHDPSLDGESASNFIQNPVSCMQAVAKQQTLFYLHGDQELQRRITPMSNDGFCTVVKGVRVHFSQL